VAAAVVARDVDRVAAGAVALARAVAAARVAAAGMAAAVVVRAVVATRVTAAVLVHVAVVVGATMVVAATAVEAVAVAAEKEEAARAREASEVAEMAMALPLAVEAAAAAVAAVAAAATAAVAGWAASVEAEVARAERTGACTPPAGGHWPYTRLVARRGNSHPRVGNGSHRLQCGKQCPCRRRRLSEVTTGRAQNRPGRCCADRRVCSGRVGWRRNRPSGGEQPTRRRKPTDPSYLWNPPNFVAKFHKVKRAPKAFRF